MLNPDIVESEVRKETRRLAKKSAAPVVNSLIKLTESIENFTKALRDQYQELGGSNGR